MLLVFLVLLFPATWIVILIHGRAHALVAEKHTSLSERVVARVGVPVLCCGPATLSRWLGLERTHLLIGFAPYGGRTGHAPVRDRANIRELYAAGTRATCRIGIIASALGLLLLGGVLLLPSSAQHIFLYIPIAILAFAFAALCDVLNNRVIRLKPKRSLPEGNDGYVLWRLDHCATYWPRQMTVEELLPKHRLCAR
jgi:hypothetical protein